MYVCMYVCVYIYIYTCICIHTHMCYYFIVCSYVEGREGRHDDAMRHRQGLVRVAPADERDEARSLYIVDCYISLRLVLSLLLLLLLLYICIHIYIYIYIYIHTCDMRHYGAESSDEEDPKTGKVTYTFIYIYIYNYLCVYIYIYT